MKESYRSWGGEGVTFAMTRVLPLQVFDPLLAELRDARQRIDRLQSLAHQDLVLALSLEDLVQGPLLASLCLQQVLQTTLEPVHP